MFEEYIANDYIRAGIIFLVLIFALRVVASIAERLIIRLVSKTKTDLDDIILKKSSAPITLILLLVSVGIALNEIPIDDILLIRIDNVLYSLGVIFIAYLIYVVIDVAIFEVWTKFSKKARIDIGESLGSLIHGTLKIILIAISILYILHIWGVEITPLLAGLGIAGLAIALALQPVLANIFSGVSIILDKSVRVGDLVYLEGTKGRIDKIGLRSTQLVTFDNELIIIPNTKLAESVIQNIALPEPKTRVVIPFGVAYGSDIEKVKKTVMKEIKTIKGVLDDPAPFINFREMADSSLNFKAYFYVPHFGDRFAAEDEANTKIYNALNRAGIEIPFPQMDVHLDKK
jgi:small-conductance mechanosensitive channel